MASDHTGVKLDKHIGTVLWLTGLSGAGKSTVAMGVERALVAMGQRTYVLDGDKLRAGLCADLGFSDVARRENIRRAGEVARILAETGVLVIAAFITPFAEDRARIRQRFGTDEFFEVYCSCPIEVCERRDVKGLYRQARAGQITLFTGISSPYEVPADPDLVLHSDLESVDESVEKVLALLVNNGVLPRPGHG